MRMRALILIGLTIGLVEQRHASAQDSLPLLREVLGAVGDAGVTFPANEVDQAAVRGIINQFGDRLALVEPNGNGTNTVTRVEMHDSDFYRIVIDGVEPGLAAHVVDAIAEQTESMPRGLVLDLRYAGGRSYDEVARVVGLFAGKGKPVIEVNGAMLESQNPAEPLGIPVVVLVNRETSRAAEALAAALRQVGRAVIIGQSTAGKAWTYRETVLPTGQKLQIASGDLKLGDGSMVSREGVTPDIEVMVDAGVERRYFRNPYFLPEGERRSAPRINEAELVRRRNNQLNGTSEMFDAEAEATSGEDEEEPDVLRDPSLGRALDLLKGLVLIR